ncbi:chorismate synthase [Desulfobotulus alkaliphilus]|uniref:Chorismate synthase n=1 Tax=Desulfobotulus alkaliphilus TaxID=622671 RepID=A0A562R9M2_9BACT|nr:chorismate synthase [Desulfobotulus alkaliphilus]TWI65737.1 chorismate synthase [Desulfobotulus alkaliphilus]
MAGSTTGHMFRVTTWGESHGPAVGCVIDGCPPGLRLDASVVQRELDRRKPGQAKTSTTRREADICEILSGVFEGKTTGTPISILVWNKDARSGAYEDIKDLFRPGHGDLSYQARYGIRDWRGGGRASARETIGRVAAGAVAGQLLFEKGIAVRVFTLALGGVKAEKLDMEAVHGNPYGCPDSEAALAMDARVEEVKKAGDSIGGLVELWIDGLPAGLGDPVFDKLDGDLASAMMGIGAVKSVEIGAGFAVADLKGSESNDAMAAQGFLSNNSGGILAGISSGARVVLRLAVKPIPSIGIPQQTVDIHGAPATIVTRGRHDVSAIPRILPVAEAMAKLVIADHMLRWRAIQ